VKLTSGTRLGPYEIQAVIGAGGMGEVYTARDTRLDRTVAIKVLPADLSADPDRRARFEREAKTIAGLNHPHICTLHDVGDHGGSMFLVMEHIAGETLAARLRRGPLPLEQAVTVATEIADALSAAHHQGVIHRDLKPANVMLTKAGAKLLDFGLAKLKAPRGAAIGSLAASTAATQELATSAGTLLGTVPYMAPEQLEGKEADARSDVFAFGALLYEMLAGRRAFEGESQASIISAIMSAQPPPPSSIQPVTPRALDRLVRKCLAKNADARWQAASDVADELRWVREAGDLGAPAEARPRSRRTLWTGLLMAAVGAAALVGAGLTWLLRSVPPGPSLARVSLDVRPADELNAGGVSSVFLPTPGGSLTALAWTPDGRSLVFVGRRAGVQQLYVRRLDTAEAQPLPGTEGAQEPAVSPNAEWVAFWARGVIRKVRISGGPVTDLASGIDSRPCGLVWDAEGRLFFSRNSRIWAIPAEGKAVPITTLAEEERGHILPSVLPGDRVLLYTVRKGGWSSVGEEVVAQTLATGTRTRLLTGATDARYVPTGHLVFMRLGVLYAVPFDPERLQVRGPETPVLGGVAHALTASSVDDVTRAGQFAVSPNGTLAWLAGPVAPYQQGQLVTVDRRGQVAPLSAPVRGYGPALRRSPDGRRLAVTIRDVTGIGLWVHDLARGALLRLTMEGEASWPLWSPEGQHLLFFWSNDGRVSLAMQPADGVAQPRELASGPLTGQPSSFTRDGRLAAVTYPADNTGPDIVLWTIENDRARAETLIQSPKGEQWPEFSPDGRWLLYGSNMSGTWEVYLRPYPGPGASVPVSIAGGSDPAWRPDGHEIFFMSPLDPKGQRRMMVVGFQSGTPPTIGSPRELFTFDPRQLASMDCVGRRCYDVAADGQRFYSVQYQTPPPPAVVTHVNLIQNWFEDLKAKAPTGR